MPKPHQLDSEQPDYKRAVEKIVSTAYTNFVEADDFVKQHEQVAALVNCDPLAAYWQSPGHLPTILRALASDRQYELMLEMTLNLLNQHQQGRLINSVVQLAMPTENEAPPTDDTFWKICRAWYLARVRNTEGTKLDTGLLGDPAFQFFAKKIADGRLRFINLSRVSNLKIPNTEYDVRPLYGFNFYNSRLPISERSLSNIHTSFDSLISLSNKTSPQHIKRTSIRSGLRQNRQSIEEKALDIESTVLGFFEKLFIPPLKEYIIRNMSPNWFEKALQYFTEVYSHFWGYYIYEEDKINENELIHLKQYGIMISEILDARNQIQMQEYLERIKRGS